MKLKPLANRLVVDRDEDASPSTIIIVPTAKDKSVTGTVVSVGPDVVSLEEGDRVMFPETGGVTVMADGIEFFLITEDAVMAKFDKVVDEPIK